MSSKIKFTSLENQRKKDLYQIEGFSPQTFDKRFLDSLGLENTPENVAEHLLSGSQRFQRLYQNQQLTSPDSYVLETSPKDPFQIHNYTGMCPTNVFEVNPAYGSCSASCLYCLVTDGDQVKPITVYGDYSEKVAQELESHKGKNHFFYYSPKTEAFSEPLLESGVAHDILRKFDEHYQENSDSQVRIFIATKAGPKHLGFQNKGDSVLGLLGKLRGKVQLNGSIGIMPSYLHQVLEPNAASIDERLEAMQMCQDAGIFSHSVLAQPIIPGYFNEEKAEEYLEKLRQANVTNIKPEFLTVNMENLSIIAQYVNHFNPELMQEFLGPYVSAENQDHVKQRCRTAPDRKFSLNAIEQLASLAGKKDISISLCNWVRSELPNSLEDVVSLSKKRGFRCLGYQENLFK